MMHDILARTLHSNRNTVNKYEEGAARLLYTGGYGPW